MKKYEDLKALVASLQEDVNKFSAKGNSAAGTRIRKSMQEIKNLAQAVRIEVQESKNRE